MWLRKGLFKPLLYRKNERKEKSMRKLEGLHFLQEQFPEFTVDCIFVDKLEDLDEKELNRKEKGKQLWRSRGGKNVGSELNLPQATCTKIKELKRFIQEQKKKDSNMKFVIHTVTPEYFAVPYVGTLAVYNNISLPRIRIELQKVTKELVDGIDTGKRPRDWPSCLILDYDFCYKFPKILKNEGVNLEKLKYPITTLFEAGRKIFDFYDKKGEQVDTYTRFNIYDSGKVLFDDHRSSESFIPKCRCPVVSKNFEKGKTTCKQIGKDLEV